MTAHFALVAFDIDGTLLDSGKRPQPGTLRAFEAMRRAGTRIMLASGRPIPGLHRLAGRLGLGDDLVFAGLNGSVVVDQASGETLAEHPLPDDVAAAVIRAGREHGVTLMLPHRRELVVESRENPQVDHEAEGNDLTVRVVEDLANPGIRPTKVLFSAPRPELEALEARLREAHGDEIELAYSSPIYMEATAAGVDKSTAIRDFCASRGIARESTAAFGDNGNDVTMLAAAGLGVAMGNGIPEVKAIADVVTTTNDDEGIARVLSRHYDFELD